MARLHQSHKHTQITCTHEHTLVTYTCTLCLHMHTLIMHTLTTYTHTQAHIITYAHTGDCLMFVITGPRVAFVVTDAGVGDHT